MEELEMKDKIKLSKSIIYDYFTLQKNNDVPFYFNKGDLDVILQELIELKQEINKDYNEEMEVCEDCGYHLNSHDHCPVCDY